MRVQLKKIMCAVDFSDFTDETLAYSIALCRDFHAKLILAHIVTEVNTSFLHSEIAINRAELQDEYISNAQELLGDLAKEITIEYEILIRKGDPAEEISRLALLEEIDLLITATHGKSGIKRLLIGSVTEKLIKILHCPLLVLRSKKHDFISPGDYKIRLKKILVGCDFSPDSKLAFNYGLSLAQEYQAELYLTHIIKPTEHIELKSSDYINVIPGNYVHWRTSDYFEMQKKVTQENQKKMKELCSRLERQLYYMIPEECQNWCTPQTILLTGEPYKELTKYAKEQEIDIIVLGISGHTLLDKLLVGSTTDRVIRQAPCPVLAVRPMD